MHSTIAASIDGFWRSARTPDDTSPPSIAVVVPTVSAGEALRRTLERVSPVSGRAEIVTREDFYARLHQGVADAPPMLSAFEREVLLVRAAEHATSSGAPAPFRLRPGLVVEILSFYDELRRRDRTVDDFDRLMSDSLQSSVEIDRGAERLYRQTRFLATAFAELERLVERSGRLDEHTLRALLLRQTGRPTYTHVVVTAADQAADPRGLWAADFDLLARLNGIDSIDLIATENLLAAGFHQRAHDIFPGIEEERCGSPATPPMLLAPAAEETNGPRYWFICRDREEELVDVARITAQSAAPDRIAIVFQRPLPYLYLARSVFDDAEQEYQALDALPLAAEPFAAALDLIFAFLLAEANRSTTIDLLGSPHWRFPELEGSDLSIRAQVAALDTLLRELKYLGGWDKLDALTTDRATAARAARAAVAAGRALRTVRDAARASDQIRALLDFVRAYERLPADDSSWASRHLRTRAAVIAALEALAAAHARHDDRTLPVERLAGSVRRWIEGQTFAPKTGALGVTLLDAQAASYASVDEVRLVGLIENDWPDRGRRSIFYPSNLLSQLGWPGESERLAAARARFHDLLRLPTTRISASTFTLEDDAIVSPSSFLEDLESSGLAVTRATGRADRFAFRHERLLDEPAPLTSALGAAGEWFALRRSRSSPDAPAYHGDAGPRNPRVYAISHVERYLDCPFKYFSARVLDLDEERDDESGLTPQERGQLLHEVFQSFFARWHEQGGRAITADTLADALELFEAVAEETIARLPEGDRALERTYLLGSAAAGGLGERAFNFEIEQETPVLERLLEHPLEGPFEFRGPDGPVRIRIRAKADRIDLLEDGTLRVIDYKLGRAPKTSRALQLPVYGICAEQRLGGRHGRDWKVSRAGYVAFKEKNAFVSLAGPSSPLDQALADGEQRLVQAIAAIERGEFPVRPDEPFLCTRCGYAGVCRKDYVGDE
jgi:RecB family exonuclease